MKRLYIAIVFITSFSFTNGQYITLPPSGDNQHSEVAQWIGPVRILISYNSPNVAGPGGQDRKGKIWGGAAHYGLATFPIGNKDIPWRAGANENTTISFSHDVLINGKPLNAGTYGFFIIIEKDKPWTLIFSKTNSAWGSFWYEQANDALRIEATPTDATHTEWLTYGFDEREPARALAYLQWDNKRVSFEIKVPDINAIYLTSIREELKGAKGMIYYNWLWAAQFCSQNNINLDEALIWASRAADDPFFGKKTFETLMTKASIQEKLGHTTLAEQTRNDAIQLPGASIQEIHNYARGIQMQGKNERALEIFKQNRKLHPEDNFTTLIGLARGYTGVGDKKNAIKYWELAIKGIPEDQKQNLPSYENELRKLKEGK